MTMTQDTTKQVLTYSKYFMYSAIALNIMGQVILDSTFNQKVSSRKKKGRLGAVEFEKKVGLPALRRHEKEIIDTVNAKFASLGLNASISSLDIPSAQETESQSRSWMDYSFNLLIEGVEVLVPVNIKYGKGTTKDNLGGWKAVEYALFGGITKTQGSDAVFNHEGYSNGSYIESPIADYYFLGFTHGEKTAAGTFRVSSLLALTDEEKVVNLSQSLPIQARIKQSRDNTDLDMAEARLNFLTWFVPEWNAKREEKLKQGKGYEKELNAVRKKYLDKKNKLPVAA